MDFEDIITFFIVLVIFAVFVLLLPLILSAIVVFIIGLTIKEGFECLK